MGNTKTKTTLKIEQVLEDFNELGMLNCMSDAQIAHLTNSLYDVASVAINELHERQFPNTKINT